MNAMLEARMVAVRIHGWALSTHGTPRPPVRNMASSQGVLIRDYGCHSGGFWSGDRPGRALADSSCFCLAVKTIIRDFASKRLTGSAFNCAIFRSIFTVFRQVTGHDSQAPHASSPRPGAADARVSRAISELW